MAIPETVGERIKERQRQLGVPNDELARVARVHLKTVSQWRNDRQMPTDENLEAIAPILKTSVAWLRYGEKEGPARPRLAPVPPEAHVSPPRVAQGLTPAVRIWLQEFLLEITKAGASEQEVESARRLLTAPELFTFYAGGYPKEFTEAQVLQGMQGIAVFIRSELRKRGRRID